MLLSEQIQYTYKENKRKALLNLNNSAFECSWVVHFWKLNQECNKIKHQFRNRNHKTLILGICIMPFLKTTDNKYKVQVL